MATFADLAQARRAVHALEVAGVEANDVSLVGKQVEDAAESEDTRTRDERVVSHVSKRAVVGGAAGTVAGGALGFIAGAIAFGIPGIGPVVAAGVWAATAGGAVAGGSVGAVASGIASLPLHEDWELTWQQGLREGRVFVAVHADDPAEAGRAEGAFRDAGAQAIARFDAQGRRVIAR